MANDLVTSKQTWQDVRVSLGADAEVSGKLSFATATRIEGKLKGEIRSTDVLVIGPSAVVQATVRADRLIVLGEVHGEVQARSEERRVGKECLITEGAEWTKNNIKSTEV